MYIPTIPHHPILWSSYTRQLIVESILHIHFQGGQNWANDVLLSRYAISECIFLLTLVFAYICIIYHISIIICHTSYSHIISYIMYHVSYITYHISYIIPTIYPYSSHLHPIFDPIPAVAHLPAMCPGPSLHHLRRRQRSIRHGELAAAHLNRGKAVAVGMEDLPYGYE